MPFTFAHPAIVLPLARCRFLHFPALVLGSLSPDFVYFLGGRAAFGIGHTWWGMVWVNLPLCFVFYYVYKFCWRDVLHKFLPDSMNALYEASSFRRPVLGVAVFILSAFIGMASHVFLDAFTHESGYFVQHWPILREQAGWLPIFKYLQYGGGVLGMVLCAWFLCYSAKVSPYHSDVSTRAKWRFWVLWVGISLVLLMIWQGIAPIRLSQAATMVIRVVDCMVLALTVLSMGCKSVCLNLLLHDVRADKWQ